MGTSETPRALIERARAKASHSLTRLAIRLQRPRHSSVDSWEESPSTESVETDVAIIITTFDERLHTYCLPLIRGLRAAGLDLPIVVVINGSPTGAPQDRRSFLQAVAQERDIYPASLRAMVGLARLWNLGIQIAATEVCVLLNDDLLIQRDKVGRDLAELARVARASGVAVGNDSWSHFAISRRCVAQVGWFDERLLGFGEEDGDYTLRFREAFGQLPPAVPLSGFVNIVADDRQAVPAGEGKYSLANRVFIRRKFQTQPNDDALKGAQPVTRRLPEVDAYPTEDFRWRFQAELFGTHDPAELEERVNRAVAESTRPAMPNTDSVGNP